MCDDDLAVDEAKAVKGMGIGQQYQNALGEICCYMFIYENVCHGFLLLFSYISGKFWYY